VALPVEAVGKGRPVRVICTALATMVVCGDHVLLPALRVACGAEAGQEECEQTSGNHEIPGDTSLRNERW
jgi:hypothetical protein